MHNVLIIAGGQIPYHNYPQTMQVLADALHRTGKVTTTTTHDAAAAKNLSAYDVVVIFTDGDYFDDAAINSLAKFVRSGKGLVSLHTAAGTNKESETFGKLIGSRIESGKIFEHKVLVTDPDHPITHRIQDFLLDDEVHVLTPTAEYRTLMSAWLNGRKEPLVYVKDEGKGRTVHLATAHALSGVSNPQWQQVFTRSVRWAAGEDWSNKTIKAAAIGYGGAFNMGKTHLESCKRARMVPTAVCDVDPLRTATAKAELGEQVETFNSVDDLLARSDADLCLVITPHYTHAPLSIQVLNSGRHVVTEKPYTITVDEATSVIETAKRAKKMATVFHNRRWDGDFLMIRQLIASGTIGDVFHIECAFGGFNEPRADWWRSYKDQSGGAFFDWGAHFVDWVLQLMPHKIESVSGDFKKLKWHHVTNEDYTSAYIRFEGDRSASIEQGSINAIEKARWRILGTKGGIEKRASDKAGLHLVQFGHGQRIESTIPHSPGDWDGFYRNVADHLLVGEPLIVTPESARKVIAVLNLAEQSSKQGGTPLPLPFEQ